MSIGQIVEGTYNNLTNKEEDLYKDRIAVCKECKLYREDKVFGAVCNSRLYLNPATNEVSGVRAEGFKRGCGCVLGSKCRVKTAKCPLEKW